jgi:hypothetical protein
MKTVAKFEIAGYETEKLCVREKMGNKKKAFEVKNKIQFKYISVPRFNPVFA